MSIFRKDRIRATYKAIFTRLAQLDAQEDLSLFTSLVTPERAIMLATLRAFKDAHNGIAAAEFLNLKSPPTQMGTMVYDSVTEASMILDSSGYAELFLKAGFSTCKQYQELADQMYHQELTPLELAVIKNVIGGGFCPPTFETILSGLYPS